jgi:hypothetical protein
MAKTIIQAITADDIDTLGVLLADISRLTAQADAIKTRLKKGGVDKYNGDLYTATIVEQQRTSYDPRKVEIFLGDRIGLVEKVTAVTKVMVTSRQV